MTERDIKWFYVEIAVTHRDREQTWVATVTESFSGKEAESQAVDVAREKHPGAEYEFFMSRRITEEKYHDFKKQMEDGTFDIDWWTAGRHS